MGNEERMNRSLARAKEEQEQGAYYLLDSQPFEEFIEAPTFSGFVDSAIEATGQFAPTAITSIIAALTGAGVGAGLSYLTGSTRLFAAAASTGIQTIPATIAARGVLKSEVEDVLKKKVTIDVLKKQGRKTAIALTPGEEKIINLLYPYLRNQIRNKYATRGAIAGAFAQEMPIGAGIAFGDYAEQGMTDPVKAFRSQGQGAIFGAIGGAIGVGVAASKYLEGIARQPELQGYLLGQFFIMMALVDALPIISLEFGLIQLFG